jgi:hypothetical protein
VFDSLFGDIRVTRWPQHRLLYVRVPKSGNTSINAAIPGGRKQRLASRRLAKTHPDWLTFSFVRNPWSRLVSTWFQKVRIESANQAKMVDGVFKGFRRLGLEVRPDMPFPEFAELVCALRDDQAEKHLQSQCHFLVRDGELVPAFLGRLENMRADWAEVLRRAGIDYELPHLNKTKHAHYSSYFPDEGLVKLVGERYAEDVERFEYRFERA